MSEENLLGPSRWGQLRADMGGWLLAARRALRATKGGPPSVLEDPDRPFCLALDGVWTLGRGSICLAGWLWDPEDQVQNLTLITPEGVRIPLEGRLARVSREDVAGHLRSGYGVLDAGRPGFVVFIEHPSLKSSYKTFRVSAALSDGGRFAVSRALNRGSSAQLRQHLLQSMPFDLHPEEAALAQHVHPALSRAEHGQSDTKRPRRVVSFGVPPEDPEVSVIIPLFRNLELFQAQFACLAGDECLRRCDIVFVLDSPEMEHEFDRVAYELEKLYGLPLTLITLPENLGFSSANNFGARYARAPYLLFLNSDVFPACHGWIDKMKRFYEETSDIGVLGVKLLYEDDSLQHAGMYFTKEFYPGRLWQNMHYFKGFPRDYGPANVTRRVPAVTGACLMVSRERFDLIGGWDETYLFVNFEDSDLCLRAHSKGLTTWYLHSVELYHLESQSQGPQGQETLTERYSTYNCWLENERWGPTIGTLMQQYE